MVRWRNSQDWEITLPLESGSSYVRRVGDTVYFGSYREAGNADPLILQRSPVVASGMDLILRSHVEALRRYPKFKDLLDYRLRATYVILAIFLVQEIFFASYRRVRGKYYISLRIL